MFNLSQSTVSNTNIDYVCHIKKIFTLSEQKIWELIASKCDIARILKLKENTYAEYLVDIRLI